MFLLNSSTLFIQLSLMWWCHMWYLLPLLLGCLSCGDVICGTIVVYLFSCTTIGTTFTIVGTTMFHSALHHFLCLEYVLSCSFFTIELEVPLSSTLFFLLKTLLGKSTIVFFLFFNVVYTSFLVLLTLVGGLCGLSFWCTNIY
jgi:hypothetical protein